MKRREFSTAVKRRGLSVICAGDHHYDFEYRVRRNGKTIMTFEMTSKDDIDSYLFTVVLICKTLTRKWEVRQPFQRKKWDRELLDRLRETSLQVAYTEIHHLVWTIEQEEKEAEKRRKYLTKNKKQVD